MVKNEAWKLRVYQEGLSQGVSETVEVRPHCQGGRENDSWVNRK